MYEWQTVVLMKLGPHPNIDSIFRLQAISITAAVAQQTIISITFPYIQSNFLVDRFVLSVCERLKFYNSLRPRDKRAGGGVKCEYE